jgi:SRSO17 transposase
MKKMKHSQDITQNEAETSTKEVIRWVKDLTELHAHIAPHFARPEPRRRALAYLKGVMSEVERRNGWQLAEQAREATPYGMQRLLAAAVWDENLVRDELRDYVYEHLGTPDGILVIDETSFPKRGEKSAGVKVQYCGTEGELENCQVAVFLDYVTALGHTLIDRELYLPKSWIDDRERCREAGIPNTVGFRTKCQLARLMIERIYHAKIPISWIVADTVYGNNLDLRDWLEEHGYRFVLAVARTERIGIRTSSGQRKEVRVSEVEADLVQDQDWQRLSMGDGTKGPRLFDWVCVPILHKWEDDGCHWLLIRRCIDNPKKKTYYIVFGPHDTTLQKMVTVIGYRWRIEDDFKSSKGIGLDQYEVRRWICWYRHITLVMLAHALLAVICAESRKTIVVDAFPSSVAVLDSSPPSNPHVSPMIPEASPSLAVLSNSPSPVVVVDSSPPSNPHVSPMIPAASPSLAALSNSPSSVVVVDSFPLPHVPSIIPAGTPPLSVLPRPSLGGPLLTSVVSVPKPVPPLLCPAPLTIPEVRHLLGHLIWPASTNATFVLAWSAWRRYHRGMSSYYHTKRRLDAG